MTNRTYVGHGAVFIDSQEARPDGCLQNNMRLSVCFADEYVAIMEVKLPEGVQLRSGSDHIVHVRMLTDRELATSVDYEIRDPIKAIGRLRLIDLSFEEKK